MKANSIFIYSDELLNYKFHAHHPFNQIRLKLTVDLLKKIGALNDSEIIPPRMATDEELLLVHDERYIEAVKQAGYDRLSDDQLENYGLGTEDTPAFLGMHEASSTIVGGSLTAAEYVMSGKAIHTLHLGGGLHHSLPGRASGFCIYNDIAVAIQWIRKNYDVKILYIDTDAHHGDGVQWMFYDDPNVCTLSIHETGRYLFPGTGNMYERGYGVGYGYSFNIPLDAFTEDESWLEAYQNAVIDVTEYFQPDVIVTQNGADAHYYDPLTHLSTSVNIYREIPKLAHKIAHQYCNGRWIALGGGGYEIWRVVPRAWSMIWLEMTEQKLLSNKIPTEWIKTWQPETKVQLPASWEDPPNLYPAIPRKPEIEEKNKQTVLKALEFIKNRET